MPRRLIVLASFLAVALVATAASAQSLKERREMKKAEKKLKGDDVQSANKACGAKLKLRVDWKSFKGKLTDKHSAAVAANYCVTVADGLRYACDKDDGKKAVKGQIKTITCRYDEGATRDKLGRYGPSLSLKKKKLTAGYAWDTGNIADETKAWAEDNLKVKGTKLSLKAAREQAAAEAVLGADNLKDANKACKTELKVAVDWKSFDGHFEGNHSRNSAAYYCNSVLDGIRYVCSDDIGQEAIKEAVKSVTCRFDASITKDKIGRYGPALKKGKKGSLEATYGWDTGNMADGTKAWLLENL